MPKTKPEPSRGTMRNPYETASDHGEVEMGRRMCWTVVALFLMLLTLPPLYRNLVQGGDGPVSGLFQKESGQSLRKHLKVYEAEDLEKNVPFAEPPRAMLLTTLLDTFGEGQGSTVMGENGWFFYRPAIESLVGYGPLKPEPESVTKDPEVKEWNQPLPVIRHFQNQLSEAGVELILVPIPVKTMIYPEKLSGADSESAITHRDAKRFYQELRSSGITIIDLTDRMMEAKKRGDAVFLKQDTHWSPAGMKLAAKGAAQELKKLPWFEDIDVDEMRLKLDDKTETFSAWGDLVSRLELDETQLACRFEKEEVSIRSVIDWEEEEEVGPDRESPIVLLGDSFSNIYSQASMNFGSAAGFPEYLSLELGLPLDVIAQNGQGATGVRQTLFSRPEADKMLRSKKAVIWAIAARDLLLSKTPARKADVSWENAAINTAPKSEKLTDITIRGRVIETSTRQDPTKTPYKHAITDAIIRVEAVLEPPGANVAPEEIRVSNWAFRDSIPSPAYQWKDGLTEVTLKLTDYLNAKESGVFKIAKVTGDIDMDFDNPRDHYWVTEDLGASIDKRNSEPPGLSPQLAGTITSLMALAILAFCLRMATDSRK